MMKKAKKQLSSVKNLRKFFLGFCMLATFPIFGQSAFDALKGAPSTTTSTFSKNVSVGLNIGVTNGVGLDIAYRFAKHWAGKVAFNYADYAVKGYTYSYSTTNADGTKNNQTFSMDAGVNLSNLGLNIEYSPGAKGRFKLVGGLTYYPTNTITASARILTALKFNDVVLNPEDLGSGDVTVGFKQSIAPYLGMSFGRTFPRKRLNVSFDLGAHYKGDYKVGINVNPGAILKENEENAAVLERNLNQLPYGKIWPNLNLRLAYNIR
jgi:hypothetical protein